MTDERSKIFDKAKQANENENYDEAVAALKELIALGETINNKEMELVNWIVNNKTTTSAFGNEKKEACYAALEILERIKLSRNAEWLENYESALYDCFSKLNRCVRDDEREKVWCRLKELYKEVFLAAHKVWKDKNMPELLVIYVSLSKLVKFYLDVADEETMKICQDAANEAKYLGKGSLDDEQFRDTSARINEIKKNIGDAERGKRDLADN